MSDVASVKNQAALAYAELPAFLQDLRKREGIAAAALEFQILTASRPGNAALRCNTARRLRCELCGLTIDRHEMVDDGEGPLFYCIDLSPDEMTLPELERRAELRRQEEVAAILARMDALAPCEPLPPREPEPYRPAASTVNAFNYLVAAGDVDRIRGWLADRPKDAPYLLLLLEGKDHAQAL